MFILKYCFTRQVVVLSSYHFQIGSIAGWVYFERINDFVNLIVKSWFDLFDIMGNNKPAKDPACVGTLISSSKLHHTYWHVPRTQTKLIKWEEPLNAWCRRTG